MSKTSIEWTDRVWNPVTGCTKVSAGCKNCYAETFANRKMGEWKDRKFSDVKFHEDRLSIPSKIRKPSKFFVNSMSDLFHEKVSFDEIDKILEVIIENPKHIFQVLTKRPERALKYFKGLEQDIAQESFRGRGIEFFSGLPKNLWLGISVENQDTANERIPLLLQIPVKIRFLSMEPFLTSVDFLKVSASMPFENHPWRNTRILTGIDWVIVGGESGHGARPMHPGWVRSIRDQCISSNVNFFFKQWGEWAPRSGHITGGGVNFAEIDPQCKKYPNVIRLGEHGLDTRKIDNCNEKSGEEIFVQKVGKKLAGRILDGREWNEMPELYREEGE